MSKDDKALNFFLAAFDERKRKESARANMEQQIIDKKRKVLAPIKAFLVRFNDLGLIVPDAEIGNPGISLHSTRRFNAYEMESSPSWAPGISLCFDHPAPVEIAVPNEADVERMGVVVMKCASSHRDKNILEQKHLSVEGAKDALARFLGKTAISIETDPRKKAKEEKASTSSETTQAPAPQVTQSNQNGQKEGLLLKAPKEIAEASTEKVAKVAASEVPESAEAVESQVEKE